MLQDNNFPLLFFIVACSLSREMAVRLPTQLPAGPGLDVCVQLAHTTPTGGEDSA